MGLSPSIALPLAEATRLLGGHAINNSWEADSVREADMFVRDLASGATATTSTSREYTGAASAHTWERPDLFTNVIERAAHTASNDAAGAVLNTNEVPSRAIDSVTTSNQAMPVPIIPSDQPISAINLPTDQTTPAATTSDYYTPAMPTEDSTDEAGPSIP